MLDNNEHLLYKLWWSKLSPVNAAHMKWGRNNTQKLKICNILFLVSYAVTSELRGYTLSTLPPLLMRAPHL